MFGTARDRGFGDGFYIAEPMSHQTIKVHCTVRCAATLPMGQSARPCFGKALPYIQSHMRSAAASQDLYNTPLLEDVAPVPCRMDNTAQETSRISLRCVRSTVSFQHTTMSSVDDLLP